MQRRLKITIADCSYELFIPDGLERTLFLPTHVIHSFVSTIKSNTPLPVHLFLDSKRTTPYAESIIASYDKDTLCKTVQTPLFSLQYTVKKRADAWICVEGFSDLHTVVMWILRTIMLFDIYEERALARQSEHLLGRLFLPAGAAKGNRQFPVYYNLHAYL
jgi:hypothetical protein